MQGLAESILKEDEEKRKEELVSARLQAFTFPAPHDGLECSG